MKSISASTYNLFYANSQIGHSVFYGGSRVIGFRMAGNYYRITLYDNRQINITPQDILQVKNTNTFIIEKGN